VELLILRVLKEDYKEGQSTVLNVQKNKDLIFTL
jgi:hypothetical protein